MERPFGKGNKNKKKGFFARLTEEVEEPLIIETLEEWKVNHELTEEERIAEQKRAEVVAPIARVAFGNPWDRFPAA